MKSLLLFLFLFSCNYLFAQTPSSDSTSNRPHRIQLGILFSPDYCYRILKIQENNSTAGYIASSRNSIENPKLGYTAGLNIHYSLTTALAVQAGIQFSNKGYQSTLEGLVFGNIVDPRNGFTYNYSGQFPTNIRLIDSFYYLDIPVKLNYTVGKKKVRFLMGAGVAANFLLNEKTTIIYEYPDGTNSKESSTPNGDFRRFNLSPLLSVGVDWRLTRRTHLCIEPSFRYGILKIIDAPITA